MSINGISITVKEDLIERIDVLAKQVGISRTAWIQVHLRRALTMEERVALAYEERLALDSKSKKRE